MTADQIREMIHEGRELVPAHLWPGLERYFVQRVEPGQFLVSLLTNDLRATVGRADEVSFVALPDLCKFLYNYAPARSHGSRDVMDAWLTAVVPA
jgi:hypothetical protein